MLLPLKRLAAWPPLPLLAWPLPAPLLWLGGPPDASPTLCRPFMGLGLDGAAGLAGLAGDAMLRAPLACGSSTRQHPSGFTCRVSSIFQRESTGEQTTWRPPLPCAPSLCSSDTMFRPGTPARTRRV